MTKPDQSKLPSLPLLPVYGKPTSPDLPQASWFRVEDRLAVDAAADILKFHVIDIVSEVDRALLVGVHEGVLKGNGRMIFGSVVVDDYRRIAERLREGASVTEPKATGSDPSGAKAVPEQTKNLDEKGVAVAATGEAIAATVAKPEADAGLSPTSDKPITAAVPDPWDTLRIGAHSFEGFGEDNDPHGEHDFGAAEEAGERYFWKLDYHDRTMDAASADPADPVVTARVLTIMRADEY